MEFESRAGKDMEVFSCLWCYRMYCGGHTTNITCSNFHST